MNKRRMSLLSVYALIFSAAWSVSADETLYEDEQADRQAEPSQPQTEDVNAEDDTAQTQDQDQGQAPEQEPEALNGDQLRQQVIDIERDLRAARQQLIEFNNASAAATVEGSGQPQIAWQVVLEQTNLPPEPTREDCEQFISVLRRVNDVRRVTSGRDPIIDKLVQIPPQYIDLLAEETIRSNNSSLRYLASYAINRLDTDSLREQIVERLEESPSLIKVVLINGWCEDVRPNIIRVIQSADASLSLDWFQAGVELADPILYDALHEITIRAPFPMFCIDMLRTLDDYNLQRTINEAYQMGGTYQDRIAVYALEFGNIDALGYLINQLSEYNNFLISGERFNSRRINVLRHIDFRGSNDEIIDWFEENRNQLVFDGLNRRFTVAEPF